MASIASILKISKDKTDDKILGEINDKKVDDKLDPLDTKEETFLKKDLPDDDSFNEQFLQYKTILIKTLEMFKNRNKKYNYKDYYEFLFTLKTGKEFKNFILSPKNQNPVRNILDELIFLNKTTLKSTSQYFSIFYFEMSFLIQNQDQSNTLVFFVPKFGSTSQISLSIVRTILACIYYLVSMKIEINEIIFVHKNSFQNEGKSLLFGLKKNYYLQFFNEIELINPTIFHSLNSSFYVFSKKEEEEFFKKNPLIQKKNMSKIFHTDPNVRYMGLKKGDVVAIKRKNFIASLGGVNYSFKVIW